MEVNHARQAHEHSKYSESQGSSDFGAAFLEKEVEFPEQFSDGDGAFLSEAEAGLSTETMGPEEAEAESDYEAEVPADLQCPSKKTNVTDVDHKQDPSHIINSLRDNHQETDPSDQQGATEVPPPALNPIKVQKTPSNEAGHTTEPLQEAATVGTAEVGENGSKLGLLDARIDSNGKPAAHRNDGPKAPVEPELPASSTGEPGNAGTSAFLKNEGVLNRWDPLGSHRQWVSEPQMSTQWPSHENLEGAEELQHRWDGRRDIEPMTEPSRAVLVPDTEFQGGIVGDRLEVPAFSEDHGASPIDLSVGPKTDSASSLAQSTTHSTAIHRTEIVRQIAQQIAEIPQQQMGKPIEVLLNPEELGRVRMVLSAAESGVSLLISADKSETLDLMRRHIDELAAEFRQLGYQTVGFEFSRSGSGGFGEASHGVETAGIAASSDGADATQTPSETSFQQNGLDIRV